MGPKAMAAAAVFIWKNENGKKGKEEEDKSWKKDNYFPSDSSSSSLLFSRQSN